MLSTGFRKFASLLWRAHSCVPRRESSRRLFGGGANSQATFRNTLVAMFAMVSLLGAQDKDRGGKKARIDVENYVINAEINPRTQAITANVQVRFVPLDGDVSSTSFELNNALNISRVVDDAGRQIPVSRSTQDASVRLNFPSALSKGKPATVTFTYDGRLTGEEDSPVYGIKFAAIQNDFAYLMYPARWFPVNDYTVDRYTADMHITVPSGFRVIASGIEKTDRAGDKVTYGFQYSKPSFPGSIALVQGDPVRVSSQGVSTTVYFRKRQSMANPYGEETGKVMSYLTSVYGLAPQVNLRSEEHTSELQ